MSQPQCRILHQDGRIELHAPAFTYILDATMDLRGVAWNNHLSRRMIELGHGPEFDIDIDRAEQRIAITGWRGTDSTPDTPILDDDPGFNDGYHRPDYDDRGWEGAVNPAEIPRAGDDGCWARTHVFLPIDSAGKPLTLILGGWGLFDFRSMRVFVNGYLIGTRVVAGRWHTPGIFQIGAGTTVYDHLRWGQDNIIVLQLREQITRTARLDEVDPLHGRGFYRTVWPPQFEQQIVVGEAQHTPAWSVVNTQVMREGEHGEWQCNLATENGNLHAQVLYRWDVAEPVLHKQVTITNVGGRTERLLNLRLGSFLSGKPVSEGEQGFPVYLDNMAWMGLAHPAGWATGQDGAIELRQHPAALLEGAGATFQSMETVLGVAAAGEGRQGFLEHLRRRMRRSVRGHDRAYAIFEGLGSWDYDPDTAPGPYAQVVSQEASDTVLLPNLRALVDGAADAGYHFDIYSLEMWVDYHGDLIRFDPARFPDGLANINTELARIGTAPGLWIDSSMAAWSIGGNPLVSSTFTHDPAYGNPRPTLCRATDPISTMYRTAFRHHIAANGIRHIKTDNLTALCYNPAHPHLPGVYSTEAIQREVIETLRQWDEACPDVFIMLYWGYRSPWWLLHGDTIFEPGLFIEAAHPGSSPTLSVRDSVIQGLDQAQWWAEEIPPLGKDSLGVWLSSWKWNSSLGTERWQEAFVMDLCRGSLLAQPWSDGPWLDPPQRRLMADFIALLRARQECFGNSRFIIGNPWKNEPYGYCCTDGSRAFIAINNCAWTDTTFRLELNTAWGLRDGGGWELFRRYPDPARLTTEPLGDTTTLALRPFQVVLLEVVPAGETPTNGARAGDTFVYRPLPREFDEPTRPLPIVVSTASDLAPLPVPRDDDRDAEHTQLPPKRVLRVRGEVPATANGGILAVTAEMRRDGTAVVIDDVGKYFAVRAEVGGSESSATPVVRDRTYPAPWQAWRIAVPPEATSQPWELAITVMAPQGVDLKCGATFLPQ